MGRKTIPYAVGTIEYLIVNEQVAELAVLRFVTEIGSSPMTVSYRRKKMVSCLLFLYVSLFPSQKS